MTITISAVILAGGKARRMGGQDKGLQILGKQSLIQHVIHRLQPQVHDISINANRSQTEYAKFGFPVFSDELPDFQGPLSGMLTALEKTKSDFILFTPCDTPFFPTNLLDKLQSAVENHCALIAYACDEEREHPVFCLMSVQLKEKLRHYLASGERRLLRFMQENGGISVKFTKEEGHFENFNTLDDLDSYSSDDFKEG
ncbi:molybdenum cofactor guanylyltransferase MobA [Haemophilus seminalis]|jgi:molybdopterin-guanine dinucleotide biosynthesis protein A|uniref:molybdenum cofactor guanylyltransferase MobA n=1 Tax=Haemophilus seminalis TaxID=2582921 RepID=UPI0025530D42|nr:molybdenum cofactor guanylyltransferase MobA [Haemophilus seminalis]MBS6047099.1 molybdenum cofactor guanylyltransferase MobA [Haemophilus haemolyticus]MDK7280002.1 molybdenum cofactor guanylyltransferase MobA [Haemophilus seminalis]